VLDLVFFQYYAKRLARKNVSEQPQQEQQPFSGPSSGTTRVSWYQKKHSPTHYPDHHPICLHCLRNDLLTQSINRW